MPATDLVPCFYTGQNYRTEQPAEIRIRLEVRELKRQQLGTFADNGRIFLFFKRLVIVREARFWEGPLGVGNALPFARQTDGSRLHYEIPHAGDKGIRRHDLYRRTIDKKRVLLRSRINVSSRKIAFAIATEMRIQAELEQARRQLERSRRIASLSA